MNYILLLATALASGAGGLTFGIRLRGKIPLRSPSNAIRLANAKTDAEIAELEVEKVKHQLEREYAEVVGRKRIQAEETEMKQLTAGAQEQAVGKSAEELFHAVTRFSNRADVPEFPMYLRKALIAVATERHLPDFLYEREY